MVQLQQKGEIPANSYVLDLDTIEKNAALMVKEGTRLGLKVFPMTKQIGRNPFAFDVLGNIGLDSYVAVDMGCAGPIYTAGYHIGHIGHLVQIPHAEANVADSFEPDYWTVFNLEKAKEAAAANRKIGRKQDVLARIHAPGDVFYTGHEGGFEAEKILSVSEKLEAIPNISFAGVTTFPALLYSNETKTFDPTPNLSTLERTAEVMRESGRDDLEINAPGTTSTMTMSKLANAGATQVEPGHNHGPAAAC